MSDEPTVITNNVPRDVVEAWELTAKERKEFDYLDWEAIEDGRDSATFVRYRGWTYDIGQFSANWGISRESRLPHWLNAWDGYQSDSAFSGTVIRYGRKDSGEFDPECVIMGRWYC